MNNYKFKKSQILILSLLAALLTITPLLSSTVRPIYLYFVINLLIIALGAEAGLLSSAFSKPLQEDKKYPPKPLPATQESSAEATRAISGASPGIDQKTKVVKTVEKSASEKISSAVIVDKVKKCPSMPSLFFIGSGENEAAEEPLSKECLYEEEEEEEFADGLSGQELFTKAEIFIGNFYNQLKMQREESWKKIHGFYQKAF